MCKKFQIFFLKNINLCTRKTYVHMICSKNVLCDTIVNTPSQEMLF
jgi:hypothetical protein